jgi:hypothetical protein
LDLLDERDLVLLGDRDCFCGDFLIFLPSPLVFLRGERDCFCGDLLVFRPSPLVFLRGDRACLLLFRPSTLFSLLLFEERERPPVELVLLRRPSV